MRIPKFMIGLPAALAFIFITSILIPQAVQARQCLNSDNRPIPCPTQGSGGSGKRKPTKTPRPTRKPTATLTPVPSATPTLVVSELMPIIVPPTSSLPSPNNTIPGLTSGIGVVILILGSLFFGVLVFAIRRRLPGDRDVFHSFEIKDFSFGEENPTTIGSATGGAGGGKIKFDELSNNKTTGEADSGLALFNNGDKPEGKPLKVNEAEERGAHGGGGDGAGANTDNDRIRKPD